MILEIDIFGVGALEVTADMTHRMKCYVKTEHQGRYKQVQFNSLDRSTVYYQSGYDYEGKELKVKITKQT